VRVDAARHGEVVVVGERAHLLAQPRASGSIAASATRHQRHERDRDQLQVRSRPEAEER
jgi:hypothetical protein